MITVPEPVLDRFRAFSLYNSPYRAHDDGRAIDLYPESGASSAVAGAFSSVTGAPSPVTGAPSSVTGAPSPVAGTVVAVERVHAPPQPYAPEHDYLLAIDTDAGDEGPPFRIDDGEAPIARILHVDPAVTVGDRIVVGDDLGEPIRAGFFAPWVDRHLHLGFRRPGDDYRRASGSLPVRPAVDVEPVRWDGRGTVVETAETYAVLDRPVHPDPGSSFAAIGGRVDPQDSDRPSVPLDGGLPHYDRGGAFGGATGTVSLLDERVGTATDRTIEWADPTVTVDRTPIAGLSLSAVRDGLGAKLICPDLSPSIGDSVRVRIE